MKKENKCEKLNMKHAWEDSTPNIIYPTNPPQYPSKQETCQNCGLVRYFRQKVENWIEYSDGKERGYEHDDGSITIVGDITDTTFGDGIAVTNLTS